MKIPTQKRLSFGLETLLGQLAHDFGALERAASVTDMVARDQKVSGITCSLLVLGIVSDREFERLCAMRDACYLAADKRLDEGGK